MSTAARRRLLLDGSCDFRPAGCLGASYSRLHTRTGPDGGLRECPTTVAWRSRQLSTVIKQLSLILSPCPGRPTGSKYGPNRSMAQTEGWHSQQQPTPSTPRLCGSHSDGRLLQVINACFVVVVVRLIVHLLPPFESIAAA